MKDIIPNNGHYLSHKDTVEFADYFSRHYSLLCERCRGCSSSIFNTQVKALNLNEEPVIKTVTFIVTEDCNLNCTYCYEKHKQHKYMTKEIAKAGVDLLFEQQKLNGYFDLSQTKGYIIEVFGGEPFLNAEIVDYIFTYYLQKAYKENQDWFNYSYFSTSTNGTLYFKPKVQNIVNKYRGRFSVGITIDGNKDLHDACRKFHDGKGSYDLVERAVKDYYSKNDYRSTKMTLAPENVSYLCEAAINLWENVGTQFIMANCVFEDVWCSKDADVLYSQLIKLADYLCEEKRYKKYYISLFDESIGKPLTQKEKQKNYCGGNGNMLAIGTDGTLYPCARFAPYALNNYPAFKIGDVKNGIDQGNVSIKALKEVTIENSSSKECNECHIASGCAYCTANHYDMFGTPSKRAMTICDCHKARVKANQYFWKKVYQIEGFKE